MVSREIAVAMLQLASSASRARSSATTSKSADAKPRRRDMNSQQLYRRRFPWAKRIFDPYIRCPSRKATDPNLL